MNLHKKMSFYVVLLSLSLSLPGCDLFFACFFDEQIHMKTEFLPEGVMGEEYYTELDAGIRNSWFDSLYDIDFEIESGHLPYGLFLEQKGDRAAIRGIPEEAGTFQIEFEVYSIELFQREAVDPIVNCIQPNDFATFDLVILEPPKPEIPEFEAVDELDSASSEEEEAEVEEEVLEP